MFSALIRIWDLSKAFISDRLIILSLGSRGLSKAQDTLLLTIGGSLVRISLSSSSPFFSTIVTVGPDLAVDGLSLLPLWEEVDGAGGGFLARLAGGEVSLTESLVCAWYSSSTGKYTPSLDGSLLVSDLVALCTRLAVSKLLSLSPLALCGSWGAW